MTQSININKHPSKDQILLLFLCNKAVGLLAYPNQSLYAKQDSTGKGRFHSASNSVIIMNPV